VSTDQPPLPEDPALLQHLLREAQAEITRLQMLIAQGCSTLSTDAPLG